MYKLAIRDNIPKPAVIQPSRVIALPPSIKPINYREPITGDYFYKPFMPKPFMPETGRIDREYRPHRDSAQEAKQRELARNYLMKKLGEARDFKAPPTGETEVKEMLNPY